MEEPGFADPALLLDQDAMPAIKTMSGNGTSKKKMPTKAAAARPSITWLLSARRPMRTTASCMLLPGPEAQQLAIYVGWLLHRTAGGLVAGTLFVLPGLIGFIGGRARLPHFTVGSAHGLAKARVLTDAESALGEAMPSHAQPSLGWSLRIGAVCLVLWLGPVATLLLTLGPADVLSQIAVFFSKMAVVTFGGAYAVLAYVAQAAVET
jgi:hypothetical protein